MSRICFALLAAGMLAGCGSWSRVGTEAERPAGEALTDILDTCALYELRSNGKRQREWTC